ncbi:MAG: XdhC family protein [Desulfobacula sp.]|nr:XdhC family protein [Desulfobacula sp.]
MKKNIYQTACELLLSGQRIILAKTIRRSGSTPRDVGSMCIITETGELFGTVGGGLLEYQVQTRAGELFKEKMSCLYPFRLTGRGAAEAGMICGGEVDLYLDPLFPENQETLALFQALAAEMTANRTVRLVTRIQDKAPALETVTRMLVREDGTVMGGMAGLAPEDLPDMGKASFELVSPDPAKPGFFVEKIRLNPRVFLFGAGHVSVFVAQLARLVGFDLTVIDDRPEFASPERFPEADDLIVSDFRQVFDTLDISKNAYILIITRGHLHDKTVLEKALSTPAAYIGMIGSVRKRNLIYKDLMDEGIPKERLESVYSPVGLDIHAETPEEIAVSIVAELIKARNPGKKSRSLLS